MEAMLPYLRTHLDVVDDLLTPGTPRNKVYSTWRMEKPERRRINFRLCKKYGVDTERIFQELYSRRRQNYIQAYADYR